MTRKLAILAAMLTVVAVSTPAQAGPTLTIQPGAGTDLSTLTVGQSFNLEVLLSGLTTERFAYIIMDISSNSSLLHLDGSTAGPIIPTNLQGAGLLVNQASSTALSFGAYGGYSDQPGNGISSNGLLGTIHLTALAPGSGSFAMSNITTLDTSGGSPAVTADSVQNYTIGSVAPVPEPSTLVPALSGAALIGLGFAWRRRRAAA